MMQVPVRVLQRRIRQQGLRTIVQVLVQWSGAPEEMATWEDLEAIKQQFPRSPAWGQAGFQAGGIVSNLPDDRDCSTPGGIEEEKLKRPKRISRKPGWLSGPEWAK